MPKFSKHENLKMSINLGTERNFGIEILRMFLCFRIVLLHYYFSDNKYILMLKHNKFQVPCFFFVSFYFLYSIILQTNFKKMKLRLERLLIPYIIYPICVWILNNLMYLIIKFNRFNRLLSLYELILQLIVGKGIFGLGVLWFQFNLLFLSLVFFIFSNILKNSFLLSFQVIALISLFIQYSEKNYKFFHQYKTIISMPIGNIIETLTIAMFAFSLRSINIFKYLSQKRNKYIFFSVFFLFIIFKYDIFSSLKGFSSAGIKQSIVSFLLFTIFFLSPINTLNFRILVIIQQITKFTQGIYCLHFLIQCYLKIIYNKKGTFFGVILLYLISYILSFIGFKIFKSSKMKFLFV